MQLSATAILNLIRSDKASWRTIRQYPSMPIIKLILHVADAAAFDSIWWRMLRLWFLAPQLSTNELAAALNVSPFEIEIAFCSNHLNVADPLPADCFQEMIPLFPLGGRTEENNRGASAKNMVMLADFAAANPEHWRTLRFKFSEHPLDIEDIVDILQLPIEQVEQFLIPPKFGDNHIKVTKNNNIETKKRGDEL